jgi:phosphoglycerol transferase MdoB-like AlkP superfamily enzyme
LQSEIDRIRVDVLLGRRGVENAIVWVGRVCLVAAAVAVLVLLQWFWRGGTWRWWTVSHLILIFVTVVYVWFSRWFVARSQRQRIVRYLDWLFAQ